MTPLAILKDFIDDAGACKSTYHGLCCKSSQYPNLTVLNRVCLCNDSCFDSEDLSRITHIAQSHVNKYFGSAPCTKLKETQDESGRTSISWSCPGERTIHTSKHDRDLEFDGEKHGDVERAIAMLSKNREEGVRCRVSRNTYADQKNSMCEVFNKKNDYLWSNEHGCREAIGNKEKYCNRDKSLPLLDEFMGQNSQTPSSTLLDPSPAEPTAGQQQAPVTDLPPKSDIPEISPLSRSWSYAKVGSGIASTLYFGYKTYQEIQKIWNGSQARSRVPASLQRADVRKRAMEKVKIEEQLQVAKKRALLYGTATAASLIFTAFA